MKAIISLITAVVMCSLFAGAVHASPIEVSIVSDGNGILPTYNIKSRKQITKVYAEAVKGDYYSIRIKNNLGRRVGVVVAVDWRNIVSGEKSWLKNSERMYVLEAYGSGEFSGWRAAQDKINRFYFTEVPDSYAAAFGDRSAMGVIAVAAYPERYTYEPAVPVTKAQPFESPRFKKDTKAKRAEAPAPSAAADRSARKSIQSESALESAGTGYGHEEYSPSYNVVFKPEKQAVYQVYIKYEWRSTLCRLGVINCRSHRHPHNRLWDNDGFAPAPPGRS